MYIHIHIYIVGSHVLHCSFICVVLHISECITCNFMPYAAYLVIVIIHDAYLCYVLLSCILQIYHLPLTQLCYMCVMDMFGSMVCVYISMCIIYIYIHIHMHYRLSAISCV